MSPFKVALDELIEYSVLNDLIYTSYFLEKAKESFEELDQLNEIDLIDAGNDT